MLFTSLPLSFSLAPTLLASYRHRLTNPNEQTLSHCTCVSTLQSRQLIAKSQFKCCLPLQAVSKHERKQMNRELLPLSLSAWFIDSRYLDLTQTVNLYCCIGLTSALSQTRWHQQRSKLIQTKSNLTLHFLKFPTHV